MQKTKNFNFVMYQDEREALRQLAKHHRTSRAAVLRRLVREEAGRCGLWPPAEEGRGDDDETD